MTGWRLHAVRLAWSVAAALSVLVVAVSFVALSQASSLNVLLQGGIFSLRPDLPRELALLGLESAVLLRIDLAARIVGVVVFFTTAAVLILRRSDDGMATLASGVLLLCGTAWFAPTFALPDGGAVRAVADVVGTSLPFGLGFVDTLAGVGAALFLYLFPDGRFVPRWTLWAPVVNAVVAVVWQALPDAARDSGGAMAASRGFGLFLLAILVGAQIYRYSRASDATQQQQSKLVLGAVAVVCATLILLTLLHPRAGAGLADLTVVTSEVETVYDLVLIALLSAALLSLPASIAVSVLRYRLWDVDALLSRTLAYAVVSGILVAAYFAIVGAAGLVLAGRSWVVAAAATLSVAVAFQPLRKRVQDVVDRRFLRQRYDTVETLGGFSRSLHDELDLDALADRALAVVDATLAPVGSSLWCADPDHPAALRRVAFRLSAVAVVDPADGDRMGLDDGDVAALRGATGPLDLASDGPSPALAHLRDLGVCVAVPLLAHGELVGLLNLGPRRSGTGYSWQDRVLLSQLADHVAVSVRVALLVRARDDDLREHERVREEMRVARAIQEQFLPRELPEVAGWAFHTFYRPAREVGGDFYDLIDLPDGRLCVVAGDVTGKGVPAALVMATTHSVVRSEASRRASPGELLRRVNDRLVGDMPAGMFVTCLCAFLDPDAGTLVVANAGHNLPYIRGDDGTVEVRATGMPLGSMPDRTYDETTVEVPVGGHVLLHSDGLAEAHSAQGEMFGFPRVREAVARQTCASDLVPDLMAAFEEFTAASDEQEDDITLVVLHRQATPEPAPADALARPAVTTPGWAT